VLGKQCFRGRVKHILTDTKYIPYVLNLRWNRIFFVAIAAAAAAALVSIA
jgi:hypothetical protein